VIDEDTPPDPDQDSHPLELALRHGMRYSGLREVEVDPRLLLYVPLDMCERLGVVPIAVGDDLLEVATAFVDPDLDIVDARFPGLEIELVLAPIERILSLHDDLKAEH
jgi:hypothetical protein